MLRRNRPRLHRRGALVAHVEDLHRTGLPGAALFLLGDQRGELHRAQVLEDVLVQPRPQVVGDALLVVVAVLLAATRGRVDRLVDRADDVRDRDVLEVLGEEVAASTRAVLAGIAT